MFHVEHWKGGGMYVKCNDDGTTLDIAGQDEVEKMIIDSICGAAYPVIEWRVERDRFVKEDHDRKTRRTRVVLDIRF